MARLVALERQRRPRKLGLWKGKVSMGEAAFDNPMPWEMQRHFERQSG
jgi:hypothetical protein